MRIRELAAWGLDDDCYRPEAFRGDVELACQLLADRTAYREVSAFVSPATDLLREQHRRIDLQTEMTGLDWSLGIVDLRQLLAFQRRVILSEPCSVPAADDWKGLIDLCFAQPKPVVCDAVQNGASVLLRSENPNMQFHFTGDLSRPIAIHTGSPFFEVAQYRNRWFLRDGYHRAYHCLAAGVVHLPSVIVHARTIGEVGAVHPWFFPEDVLFSDKPPRVHDFLEDALVLEYNRSPLSKTLRITVEESYHLQGENV
jgi:hypothetical protein